MIIKEEKRDLFSVDDNEYYFVQCISADYAMGAGIAVEFNKRFDIKNVMREKPENVISSPNNNCLLVNDKVFNLVTKDKYFQKPTYDSLKKALMNMKILMLNHPELMKTNKVAMPRIGCGLDKLNWNKVKPIIEEVFGDTNIEILVCNL